VLERADDTLVIITPHNEAIRHEFTLAFRDWYRAKTGRSVAIDWRVIGGTAEIARFLESEYIASFRNRWTNQLHRPWSIDVQAGFSSSRLPVDAPEPVRQARADFLASDVSCGIDLFFGGGSYDFIQQANAGRFVPSRVFDTHPDWFTDGVIPETYAGERYWDSGHRWVGNVLSSFGILYNRDAVQRLGLGAPPERWSDLCDPRYLGEIALADPTKSSSIAKAFENLIQQQMQHRLAAAKNADPAAAARDPEAVEARAVREGWIDGLRILQLMGANARYFTDSSQKPPIDVGQGDCAAGVCIDFYGRSQAEVTAQRGTDRLGFVTPLGGSVSSVDPIAILRGAPHRAVAEAFVEFTLSMAGQKLWNFKPGSPGGPQHFALRRIPVRRDFYAHPEWKTLRSDPDEDPYGATEQLIYQPAWTGSLFREMSFVTRVMTLDTHDELVDAWREIIRAGRPPEALAILGDLSMVDYDAMRARIKPRLNAKNKVEEVRLARELAEQFRARYRRAAEKAREIAASAR
jgi:ABC-type Fe3+ transport system substrate-binding protein